MIVDMHCDTISHLLEEKREGKDVKLRANKGHLDLLRMKNSGYLLQNFALFVDKEGGRDPWEEVTALYQLYQEELASNEDLIAPVYRLEDIERNRKLGKLSALLTVEEGAVCQGDLEKLRTLYEWGVRMLTLTWNYPNELGYPNLSREKAGTLWQDVCALRSEPADTEEHRNRARQLQATFDAYYHQPQKELGLTEQGRVFVEEMEHLGMIIDVSHGSDALFWDVVEGTKKPFVASHSNARAVSPCTRNLTDDMIRKLAERGGCCGLNFCADFLRELPIEQADTGEGSLEALVHHAKHIVRVGGIEVLGLGSDFDGIGDNVELPGAQCMEVLWQTLHRAGFTQGDLDKIFGENVLRVYRECLK